MTVPVKVRPTSLYFYRKAILQAVPFARVRELIRENESQFEV